MTGCGANFVSQKIFQTTSVQNKFRIHMAKHTTLIMRHFK